MTDEQVDAVISAMFVALENNEKAFVQGDMDDLIIDGRFDLGVIARAAIEAYEAVRAKPAAAHPDERFPPMRMRPDGSRF